MMNKRCFDLRQLLVGAMFICAVAQPCFSQKIQVWTNPAGKSIQAELISVSKEGVVLRKGGQRELLLQFDQLDQNSQSRAWKTWFDRKDSQQFQMVRDHLASLEERPEAVGRLLLEIHKNIPDSPYAGLWASVAYSAGSNELPTAKRMILQTISRIKKQREQLPNRHETTLASAYNNYAIIALKDSGSSACAGQLSSAMASESLINSIVRHNAEQLLNLTPEVSRRFVLTPAKRSQLVNALVTSDVNSVGPKIPDGWYYSMNIDVPSDRLGAATMIPGLESPHIAMELVSIGTGVVVAPGIVLTSQAVVQPADGRSVGYLTVGTKQSDRFKTLPAKSCLHARSRVRISGGTSFSRNWGNYVRTTFRYIVPRIGSSDANIAALHVPGLDLPAVSLSNDIPSVGEELISLGYQRGNQVVERGVIKKRGEIETSADSLGLQKASHVIGGGQLGGPLVDEDGLMHGIVFRLKTDPTQTGCDLFSSRVLRSWFSKHVPVSHLKEVGETRLDFDGVVGSVVPVFGWGLRQSMTALSEMNDGTGPSESLMYKDNWCMVCGGFGFFSCNDCNNGVVSYKVRKKVGYSPIGGDIFGNVSERKSCPTCSGNGKHDCVHCVDGRFGRQR